MNKAILIGNLTRDPETKTLPSGTPMTTFTLAVNRRFVNKEGNREADFINIVTWRQLAELCARYLTKGRKCAVIGQIQTRTYDAQDGTKRYVTEVVADEVEFIGSAGQGGSRSMEDAPPPPEPTSFTPQKSGAPAQSFDDIGDDELPF